MAKYTLIISENLEEDKKNSFRDHGSHLSIHSNNGSKR